MSQMFTSSVHTVIQPRQQSGGPNWAHASHSATAQQATFEQQLALRDPNFADLERELKALRGQEEDKEPENREFCPADIRRASIKTTAVVKTYYLGEFDLAYAQSDETEAVTAREVATACITPAYAALLTEPCWKDVVCDSTARIGVTNHWQAVCHRSQGWRSHKNKDKAVNRGITCAVLLLLQPNNLCFAVLCFLFLRGVLPADIRRASMCLRRPCFAGH